MLLFIREQRDDEPGKKIRFFSSRLTFHDYGNGLYEALSTEGEAIGYTTTPNPNRSLNSKRRARDEYLPFGHETDAEDRARREAEEAAEPELELMEPTQ